MVRKAGTIGALLTMIIGGFTVNAQQPKAELINEGTLTEIREWLLVPVVFITLEAQNIRYRDLKAGDIDTLDKRWRAEREANEQPLIASTLNNPLSTYLTQVQAASAGLFTEIFVTGARGLNAGQSAITSDFWQGDEAKFQKTFDIGAGAVFIDEPELHEPTQTWRTQVNLTLQSSSGSPIGAATVEVNLTEMARRQSQNKGAN
ncbi:hypothetical protein [Kordiimonas sp.]|uniref:hypothetical protein n=1 Tax=Kordiimonas sp. TaxID=1970157 RepID=UPI003A8EBC55